jgi:hypothetical protein
MKPSKRRLKTLVSDLKILKKEIERPGASEGVEKLLETIADGRLEPQDFRTLLRRGYKDESARVLEYILNYGDDELLDILKNSGVSTDIISYLEKIINTYAFIMKDYRTTFNYPRDIEIADGRLFYSFDAQAPFMQFRLTMRNGEETIFEGPVTTYLWLLVRLLSEISDLMKKVKKDIPSKFMTPAIEKRLRQIDVGYKEFREVFVTKKDS